MLNRREWLTTIGAGLALSSLRCAPSGEQAPPSAVSSLRHADGNVDWQAVRNQFPLSRDWIHFASFLLVSHPRPVAEAIAGFATKLDADPIWLEEAAFTDSAGRPFRAVKQAIADYLGGKPEEICVTSNTTTALAIAYHGLRIRADQRILTTEHDHYSHHESIRYAAERAGCGVDYVALYDRPDAASVDEIAMRIARAIGPRTRAVGITWVHSSTGVKLPIRAIADVVAKANQGRADDDRCLLIVDGVHGFGTQDVDIPALGCDFFASGLHKWMFAPRGTGFLWGRADAWPAIRPTIPSFDPDQTATWVAWMERTPLPPTEAAFVSPGGFVAFEHLLAIPTAIELHRTIGRDRIAARLRELNGAFREGARGINGVTLHTPTDPELSAGLSCYDIDGIDAPNVTRRLEEKRIRTNHSPYKTSCARVAVGIMNSPEEVDVVLREIRSLA